MSDINFSRPPVVETVLGVEFALLKGWDLRHVGLLWQVLRDEYPRFMVKPPLGPQQDVANGMAPELMIMFEPFRYRCWFVDESENRLIQLQEDRFIHNWRKTGDDVAYPRYFESVRPTFENEWTRFLGFLGDQRIVPPVLRQWEVTYVNHLERGREWHSLSDLPDILPMWSGASSESLQLETVGIGFRAMYRPSHGDGQLQVSLQPAVRTRDQKQVLQLNLTATGSSSGSSADSILQDLDRGHAWVVSTFAALTSKKMHDLWGRVS